ncbi:hypothetical protein ABK040_006151 [Willaertia magna]
MCLEELFKIIPIIVNSSLDPICGTLPTCFISKRRSKWSAEDDALLKEIAVNRKITWKKISELYFQNRFTDQQLHQRYKRVINEEINRSPWTEQEDKAILNHVKVFGCTWSSLRKKIGTKRTDIQLRQRWVHLTKGFATVEIGNHRENVLGIAVPGIMNDGGSSSGNSSTSPKNNSKKRKKEVLAVSSSGLSKKGNGSSPLEPKEKKTKVKKASTKKSTGGKKKVVKTFTQLLTEEETLFKANKENVVFNNTAVQNPFHNNNNMSGVTGIGIDFMESLITEEVVLDEQTIPEECLMHTTTVKKEPIIDLVCKESFEEVIPSRQANAEPTIRDDDFCRGIVTGEVNNFDFSLLPCANAYELDSLFGHFEKGGMLSSNPSTYFLFSDETLNTEPSTH